MMDCPKCGKPVRLGAYRLTFNCKHGVGHYIEHRDGSAMHDPGWKCTALKPYPKNESDKPWKQLVDRWNTQPLVTTNALPIDTPNQGEKL